MSAGTISTADRAALGDSPIVMPAAVLERLLETIRHRLPRKSFGYLLTAGDPRRIDDFLIFEANTRNSPDWKGKFEAYGQYFLDHDDAGFVCTPEESWRVQKQIWASGMTEAGVFHSHLRHPANFSLIDYDLHTQRYSHIWHLIVSMRNPSMPQLRVFDVAEGAVREQRVIPDCPDAPPPSEPAGVKTEGEAIAHARDILMLGPDGLPRCRDNRAILAAIDWLRGTGNLEAIDEILARGFLAGSAERFHALAAPCLRTLPGGWFQMGTDPAHRRHFVGELPRRRVELSPFRISAVAVTNEFYSRFDPSRRAVPAEDRAKPVVAVTWFDATVFALWMGCRLPAESEWEFACGAGSGAEWACRDESRLPRMAWYSENSGGCLRPVATREPNAFDLYDLHGNVWEWCVDAYEQDRCVDAATAERVESSCAATHRVCRGGSVHALAEMCRTRYRFHDPAGFSASDLGFRLAESTLQRG